MDANWEARRDAGLEVKMAALERKSDMRWYGVVKKAVGYVGCEPVLCREIIDILKALRLEAR